MIAGRGRPVGGDLRAVLFLILVVVVLAAIAVGAPGWAALAAEPGWRFALRASLVIGLAAALPAVVLGTLVAILAFLTGGTWWRAGWVVLGAPLVAIAVLARALDGGLGAVVLAHALLGAGVVALTVGAGLSRCDPLALRAASSLGASPAVAVRRVLLPLARPGMGAGLLLAFLLSFNDPVIAPGLLGPVTLSARVLMERPGPTQWAAAIGMAAIALALMAAAARLMRR